MFLLFYLLSLAFFTNIYVRVSLDLDSGDTEEFKGYSDKFIKEIFLKNVLSVTKDKLGDVWAQHQHLGVNGKCVDEAEG